MDLYYVNNNAQTNGDHEVHSQSCAYLPSNRKYLGAFKNCKEAVLEAKKIYKKSNGCYWCLRACHIS